MNPNAAEGFHRREVHPSESAPSCPHFTLLVAGNRGGKTSFLRLLLDSCTINPNACTDQSTSIAQFVRDSLSHTSRVRVLSVDLLADLDGTDRLEHIRLTLVDTPSLDFEDKVSAQKVVTETLNFVDRRLAGAIDSDGKAPDGDNVVTLCIYFLNPEKIVPVAEKRDTSAFSHPLSHAFKPCMQTDDVQCIRELASRVNVLPVLSRADTLCNDRLSAIKMAIRSDLANAGLGFGIFDQYLPNLNSTLNGRPQTRSDSLSSTTSPPKSPVTPSPLQMPYALISPDTYGHSDGVGRIAPSHAELVHQYTSSHFPQSLNFPARRFLRSYRWGAIDVLNPAHCDFLPMRMAIFHHLKTLQDYTKEYLFDKFRKDIYPHFVSLHRSDHRPPPLSLERPVLAIDTSPTHRAAGTVALDEKPDIKMKSPHIKVKQSRPVKSSTSSVKSRSSRHRTGNRKITVACQFCRSRKLKCDGQRPSCSQCSKRSHACDYMVTNKRRGVKRKEDDLNSDSMDTKSDENDELQESPVTSQPKSSPSISRPASRQQHLRPRLPSLSEEGYLPALSTSSLAPLLPPPSRYDDHPRPGSRSQSSAGGSDHLPRKSDTELPHIATLSLPELSPTTPVPLSASAIPPFMPHETRTPQPQSSPRKRSATVPGKSESTGRLPGATGPKIVACNFCRARKTKCDGAFPACGQCHKRSLPCNYVHDSSRRGYRRSSAASKQSMDSPTSSRPVMTPRSAASGTSGFEPGVIRLGDDDGHREHQIILESPESRPSKKMKTDPLTSPSIPPPPPPRIPPT